jgi:ribose transport system ATP-binding protein
MNLMRLAKSRDDAPQREAGAYNPSLTLTNITKSFPGVTALADVSFECLPGEVHALVGENGSGKSTLLKVAAGLLTPDSGEVTIAGEVLAAHRPREARKLGLAVAYQDTALIGDLTVAENVRLSFEGVATSTPTDIGKILRRFELPFRPETPVSALGPGGRQLLEVARALIHAPRVLLLDEPTAALDMRTAEQVQNWVRAARDAGVAVVYVSHRLEEVRRLGDRLTVIRDGVMRGTYSSMDWEVGEIVELMVGAKADLEFPTRVPVAEAAAKRLEVNDLRGRSVGPTSLYVRRGEVVGIAGAEGNGQRNLLRAIIGAERTTGSVAVDGVVGRHRTPASALRAGIMFQSGDRVTESVFPDLSVLDNTTFQLGEETGPGGLALRRNLLVSLEACIGELGIVVASPDQPLSALSGGNQQKVVLSRVLLAQPSVLLLDEPTQGVDAKARLDIYRAISRAAEAGIGIVVNSSDASELVGLCDRVYIMADGAIVDEVTGDLDQGDIVRRFVSRADRREREAARTRKLAQTLGAVGTSRRGPIAMLLVLIAAVAAYAQSHSQGTFLSSANVSNVAVTAMPALCAALGQQFALIAGGLDISIGATMTLAVIVASAFLQSVSVGALIVTLLLTIGIGVVAGCFNAFLVKIVKINALVATIATLGILSGVAVLLRPQPAGTIAPSLGLWLLHGIGPVPYCFIAVALVALAFDVWLARSGSGLSLRAVGLDNEASNRLGLRANAISSVAFVLAAVGAAIGGLFLSTQVGTGSNDAGLSFALPTFAACFLGGASLSGGHGTFSGAWLGVVLLTMIASAATILGQSYALSQVIYGGILLVAVVSYGFAGRSASWR